MSKKLSVDRKVAIILEGLKKENSVKEICKNHSISKAQYYRWKKRFINGARKELSDHRKIVNNVMKINHDLRQMIYKLQIIISLLKENYNCNEMRKIIKRLSKMGLSKNEAIHYLGIKNKNHMLSKKGT
jgi:putative transposase